MRAIAIRFEEWISEMASLMNPPPSQQTGGLFFIACSPKQRSSGLAVLCLNELSSPRS